MLSTKSTCFSYQITVVLFVSFFFYCNKCLGCVWYKVEKNRFGKINFNKIDLCKQQRFDVGIDLGKPCYALNNLLYIIKFTSVQIQIENIINRVWSS
ncbi:hypothetical protein VNO77_03977 [Canavalia gladiata]|uniref:Uncharacterized protein n=1 Tax=Canavalia gladiata TaxID=3824 RepID=A0AAN9MWC7_CANGL